MHVWQNHHNHTRNVAFAKSWWLCYDSGKLTVIPYTLVTNDYSPQFSGEIVLI